MNANRFVLGVLSLSLLGSWPAVPSARAADVVVAATEELVPRERIAEVVAVRDVTTSDGAVSGIIVNRSARPVRDVRLRINHLWLWHDEVHPGEDRYSRSDTYTVPGEIPPGGTRTFTSPTAEPVAAGPRGHFVTMVEPVELVTFQASAAEAPRALEPSPSAGARPGESEDRPRPPY